MAQQSLTLKQQAFVDRLLADPEMNAALAYKEAYGVSHKVALSASSRLLKNVNIKKAIEAAQADRVERVQAKQDYVLDNLTEIVERCMERAPVMVKRGKEVVQLVDDQGRHVWRFDAKNAVSALHLLGKHEGKFAEKHEHTGKNGGPIEWKDGITEAEREERLVGLMLRLKKRVGK